MDAETDRRPLGFEMSDGHVRVCRFEQVICMVWIVNVCPCKSGELATGVTMRFFCAPQPSQGLPFGLLRRGILNLCFGIIPVAFI